MIGGEGALPIPPGVAEELVQVGHRLAEGDQEGPVRHHGQQEGRHHPQQPVRQARPLGVGKDYPLFPEVVFAVEPLPVAGRVRPEDGRVLSVVNAIATRHVNVRARVCVFSKRETSGRERERFGGRQV